MCGTLEWTSDQGATQKANLYSRRNRKNLPTSNHKIQLLFEGSRRDRFENFFEQGEEIGDEERLLDSARILAAPVRRRCLNESARHKNKSRPSAIELGLQPFIELFPGDRLPGTLPVDVPQ